MNRTSLSAFLVAIVLLCPQYSFADIPANASCVIEEYRKYSDTIAIVYESTRGILKQEHPEKFQLLEPCVEMMILDTKYKRAVVEELWSERNDLLFRGSPRLAELGSLLINSEEALSAELDACVTNKDKTDARVWHEALITQFQAMAEVGEKSREVAEFEKIMWASVTCDQDDSTSAQ